MGRKKSKAKVKQAKTAGDRRSARNGRVDHRRIDMALPLHPAIQARFPREFNAESYASPPQKAISKIIYVLYGPYLQSTPTNVLSHIEAHRLVQEKHAEAMSQIQSRSNAWEADFWVERDSAIIKFDPHAVELVRGMQTVTVAYHLWTLYNLDAFSTKEARWTFVGHSVDVELRKVTTSNRQSILNRIVYDTYLPFIELTPGGIQSKSGITDAVRLNFSTALQSIHVLMNTLNGKHKEFAKQLTKWNEDATIKKLQQLWEDGVFMSEDSRDKYLAPPLIGDGGNIMDRGTHSQDTPMWDKYDQDENSEDKKKEVFFKRSPSLSKHPNPHQGGPPPDAASIRTEMKREGREAKRRNIFFAIWPFIKPHMHNKDLPEIKIEKLVHECLKNPTFLSSIPLEEAVTGVIKLWRGKVFHDPDIRSLVLGTEKTKICREVYSATMPVMRSNLHRKLERKEIATIVRDCLKGQSFLTVLGEQQAIDLVWYLWSQKAFHNRKKREKIMGPDIDITSEPDQDTGSHHRIGRATPILESSPKNYGFARVGNTARPLISLTSENGAKGHSFSKLPTQRIQSNVTNKSDGTSDYSNRTASLAQRGLFNDASNMDSFEKPGLTTNYSLPTGKTPSNTSGQLMYTGKYERSLDDLYRDHPEKSLDHIKEPTLNLAATTIQHVAEEAVFGWLKHWFPQIDWTNAIHQADKEDNIFKSITMPKEAISGENGTPSISDLLQNCRNVSKESDGHVELDIVETVSNAIELCVVLKDNKRKVLLERAEDKIRASRSSLYSHTVEIKRRASNQLADLNNMFQDGLSTLFSDRHDFRLKKEVFILDEALDEFGKFHDRSSIELLTSLKRLLDSTYESHPNPIWESY